MSFTQATPPEKMVKPIVAVGPVTRIKTTSSAASAMSISDRIFTPPSSPRTTDISASAVMRITFATLPVPQPKREFSPASACSVPKPSDGPSPKSVAKTARMSITCPGQPRIRSPSRG